MKKLSALVLVAFAATQASAASDRKIEKIVDSSTRVLVERMQSVTAVPQFILDKAQCIAAMRTVKAGFIFGGEGSTGLVSCRLPGGAWSAPSFLSAGGASVGIIVGGQVVDNVLVFMTPASRQMLNRAQFQLGAELSIAVGPVGEGETITVANVLTYSAGTGFYVGYSLNGIILNHSYARDRDVYGSSMTPATILATRGLAAPQAVKPFVDALETFTK